MLARRSSCAGAGVRRVLIGIDVGNTNIVVGVFRGEDLLHRWRLPTGREATADDLGLRLVTLLAHHGVPAGAVAGAAVCCVVPPLEGPLREAVARYLGREPLWVTGATRSGIVVRYDNPAEVGADRIVNAAAAYHQYGGPAVIVDFGTATTFDAVSPAGEYLGGAIAPGVAVSLEALFQRASMLPRIPLSAPERAIGRNTVASMQSGVVFGFAGQVDALVRRLAAELGAEPRVIATGGLSPLIGPHCETVQHVDPDLTLHGLHLIHRLNAG